MTGASETSPFVTGSAGGLRDRRVGTCGDTTAQSPMASTWTLRESREVVERLLHTRPWGPKGASGGPDPAGAEASHGSLDNVEGTQESRGILC